MFIRGQLQFVRMTPDSRLRVNDVLLKLTEEIRTLRPLSMIINLACMNVVVLYSLICTPLTNSQSIGVVEFEQVGMQKSFVRKRIFTLLVCMALSKAGNIGKGSLYCSSKEHPVHLPPQSEWYLVQLPQLLKPVKGGERECKRCACGL